ncbi:unnamed protein product [Lupinus luteus]|uniref:SHSP domain-containing protein n=1 Tax=Lupinus luteus TaxID=3873 RepID=A0AAV1XME3_LUPLU
MEKSAPIDNQSYEDFDPVCKWRKEDGCDTIILHLPGFRREHVRIQINHLGFMVLSGEVPMGGARRRRFKKEVELPTHCNVDAVHANFSPSILSVVMPNKVPLNNYQHVQKTQIPETENETKEEIKTKQNIEFIGRGIQEDVESTTKDATDNKFVKNDVGLTPEMTKDVAFKFMVMIIVILVIVSYVEDMSKSFMAQAQFYFQD